MSLGNVARVITVAAAFLAAAGSATSTSNNAGGNPQQANMSPPPPRDMESARALGLWRSTFGAVKIEPDHSRGGLQAGAVQGIWTYQRQGQEVVGFFSGNLRGNVLQFRWDEPGTPPLTGEGYLVFDPQGRQYSGRWWSDKRDRIGDWNGWRQASSNAQYGQYDGTGQYGQPGHGAPYGGSPYGGQPYGGYPQPQPPHYPQPPQQPQQPYYPQQPPHQPHYPQPHYPQQPQQPPRPPQQPQQPHYPQQPQQPYYPQQPQQPYYGPRA